MAKREHEGISRKDEEQDANRKTNYAFGMETLYPDMDWAELNDPMGIKRSLGMGRLFTKMSVSQPGDAAEVQADAVANAVMSGNVDAAQMELEHSSGEIMAKANDVSVHVPEGFEQQLQQMKGGGMPLAEDKKEHLEEFMGTGLDHVRIHTGAAAEELSQSINARAFAHGDDIFFADDENDEELLAHEVTHVVQGGTKRNLYSKVMRGGPTEPEPYENSFDVIFFGDKFKFTVYSEDIHTIYSFSLKIEYLGKPSASLSNQPLILGGYLDGSPGHPPLPIFISDGAVVFRSGGTQPQLLMDYLVQDKFQIGVDAYIPVRKHAFTLHRTDYSKSTFTYLVPASNNPLNAVYKDKPFIADIPGGLYNSVGNIEDGLYVRVDGNGDQTREMLIKIKALDIKEGKVQWDVYNYDTGETFTKELAFDALKGKLNIGNNVCLRHGNRTDGTPGVTTAIHFEYLQSDVAFSETGTIEISFPPPELSDDKATYKVSFGGESFDMSFNRALIKNTSLMSSGAPVLATDGTVGIDLKLGQYQDRFRLILRPIPAEKKTKILLFCTEGNLVRNTTSLSLPYLVSCSPDVDQASSSEENIYLKFNLDGNPGHDLELHDRVATTSTDLVDASEGGISSYFRYHYVHLIVPPVLGQGLRDVVEIYTIKGGSVSHKDQPTDSMDVFDDYISYNVPSDFNVNSSPQPDNVFNQLSMMMLQLNALREKLAPFIPGTWVNGTLTQKLGSDELHSKWNTYYSSAYALYPSKQARKNDQAGEKAYSDAAAAFYKDLKENVDLIEKDYWFSQISLNSPDKDIVSQTSKGSWKKIESEVLYYAGKYAEILVAAAETNKSKKEEADNPLTIYTDYKSARNSMRGVQKQLQKFAEIKDTPGLQKVRAVHYPMADYEKLNAVGGTDGVPLDIYYWRDGSDWQIYDMTNPDDIYETDIPAKDGETCPPLHLFEKLNDSDFYYTGRMIVELPNGVVYKFTTKSEKDWTDYLAHIAFALLLIGLALTGVGALVDVAILGTVGTCFVAASMVAFVGSSIKTLSDLEAHDQLVSVRALLEFANIILTVGTLGAGAAGKILSATTKADSVLFGSLALLVGAAKVVYIPLKITEEVGAGMMVLALSIESYTSIKKAVDSKGNPEDVMRAVQVLLMQAMTIGMVKTFVFPEAEGWKLGDNIIFGKAKGKFYAAVAREGFVFDVTFAEGFIFRKIYTLEELLAFAGSGRMSLETEITSLLNNPNIKKELKDQIAAELGDALKSDKIMDFSFRKAFDKLMKQPSETTLSAFRKANEAIHSGAVHPDSRIVLNAEKGEKYAFMSTSKDKYKIDPVDEAEVAYVDKTGRVRVDGYTSFTSSMPVFNPGFGEVNPDIMAGITSATKVVENVVAIRDMNGNVEIPYRGDVDLTGFFKRFLKGNVGPPSNYANDGIVFRNEPGDKGRILPQNPKGYYREYYINLPNGKPNSPLRVIIGKKGEIWLSPDHYKKAPIPLN